MKKIIRSVCSLVLLMACLTSCSVSLDESQPYSGVPSGSSAQPQLQMLKVCATVSDDSRTAVPSGWVSGFYYLLKSSTDSTFATGVVESNGGVKQKTLIFDIPKVSSGLVYFKIEVYSSIDAPGPFMSKTVSKNLGNNMVVELSFDLEFASGTAGIELPVQNGTTYGITHFSIDKKNGTNLVPLTPITSGKLVYSGIPQGGYDVVFKFYSAQQAGLATPIPSLLYREALLIYPNTVTDVWADADGEASPALDLAGIHYTSYYVVGEGVSDWSGESPSDGNSGSSQFPLHTLKAALARCCAPGNDYALSITGSFSDNVSYTVPSSSTVNMSPLGSGSANITGKLTVSGTGLKTGISVLCSYIELASSSDYVEYLHSGSSTKFGISGVDDYESYVGTKILKLASDTDVSGYAICNSRGTVLPLYGIEKVNESGQYWGKIVVRGDSASFEYENQLYFLSLSRTTGPAGTAFSTSLEIKDKDNIELTSGYTSEMVLYQDGLDLSQRMATLKSTNNTLSLPSWFSAGSYQVYVKVIMEATGDAHEAWLDLTIN